MSVLVIGHRGGAGEGPQNTLTAFDRALQAGADGIECDVHLSKDAMLVVHHDPAVAVAPGAAPVPIALLTADEIRAADLLWTHGAGFEGERVPLLDEVIEVLDSAPDGWLMVEMKRGPDDEALGDAVARRLTAIARPERLVAASFSKTALRAVASRSPELKRMGVAREDFDVDGQEGLELWAQGFLRDLVPGPALDQARAERRRVWTWTVDATDQIPSLLAAGIDGLITDVPAAARAFLADRT